MAKTNKFHPFLPAIMDKPDILRWLKKVHAWTGFWGALSFLLLGVSGFLLNHRSVAKIDTGAAKEVMSVSIPINPEEIQSLEALGKWAQARFNTKLKPRNRTDKAIIGEKPVLFLGQEVMPSQIWRQRLYAPNAILYVEYTPGSTSVKARQSAQNGWGLIKNLHKGAGMGIAWVLFFDLMAGALIAMSLTGALLWSRLHGTRLLAIGIVLASLGMGVFAALPQFL